MLDLTNARDEHIDQRLRDEPILWLATVRPDGRPHLVPVWYLWDGTSILIFSKPNQQKLRNIARNPRVVLALDTADEGEDVVTLEGLAELLPDGTFDPTLPAYAAKYERLLRRLGVDAPAMAKEYSQAIRVTPTRFP